MTSKKIVYIGGYLHSYYIKDVLMASLIASAFLFCAWLGSAAKTPRWSCTPCSHSSLKSSPMTSQKLRNTQQAPITRHAVSTLRSSLFAMLLNLPFSLPYAFSTTTLVMLRILLKLTCSRVRFPRSVYGFISQSVSAYAESPNIKGGTLTPDITWDKSRGRKVLDRTAVGKQR